MKEIAEKYYGYGLSVVPVGSDKVAIGSWKRNQTELIKPNGQFDSCPVIGVVCGKVSGWLHCIDIDVKYDLTGTLWTDYKNLINSTDPNILKKMVVEKTPSGGFHLIYKCKFTEGNKKLASRETTEEEKKTNPKEKTVVLIETRGEGGYFAAAPSPGYELIYGDFSNIQEITEQERNTLIDCAKTFNQIYQPQYVKAEQRAVFTENESPFEAWNDRGDVLALLQENGWQVALQRGKKNLLKRPGGHGRWHADFDNEKRLLYVFSTSTEFESEKAYNPVQVLTTIKFNGDYSAAARWLLSIGYGERKKYEYKKRETEKRVIDQTDDNFDFVATAQDANEYIEQIRDGSFIGGKTTGHPTLDKYWLFKESNLVIINGHDNVGKSVCMWYLATLSAIYHGWKWIIYSSENKVGGIKRKIIEFSKCRSIKSFSQSELEERYIWFDKHFTLIKNSDLFTYTDMLNIGKKLNTKQHYNAFLIDPYNSLWRETNDTHEYDYRAMTEFRQFITQTECGIYLNCHSITEALRRMYPKEHEFAGHPMPPGKADTEGGGKFSNKADDFMTFHRMTQHKDRWNTMEIHVRKIKEAESGGHQTPYEEPVKLNYLPGGCGYEDINGYNPITNRTTVQEELKLTPNLNADETKYTPDDPCPF